MNTAGSFIARLNNFKKNLYNLSKRVKISNLKINIIMNNTAKARKLIIPIFQKIKATLSAGISAKKDPIIKK